MRLESRPAPSAGRLDTVLAEALPELSRSRAAALVREGVVRVDGEVVDRPSRKVEEGAKLEVALPDPTPDEAVPQDLPLRIVFEDEDVVVIDKVPGMVVHPAPGHPDGTLVNALLHHIDDLSGVGGVQRPGIVHRLDRGTSGLLVVAKNDRAHHALSGQFATRVAGRRYLALCLGEPPGTEGTIRSRLARHPKDRLRWASTEGTSGRDAITHWRVLGRAGTVALVECRLETGRTHQIRVHLTELGLPLVGDPLYRRRDRRPPASLRAILPEEADRPMLHAWQLRFEHPRTGERVMLTAPLPDDFRAALAVVGIAAPEIGCGWDGS